MEINVTNGLIFSAFMVGLIIGCIAGFFASTLSMWTGLRLRYEKRMKVIEKVLVDWFEGDDSHVVDGIVGTIRTHTRNPDFAKGAAFKDEN